MRRRVAASVLALVLVACGGGDDAPAVVLDGSPRTPDVEGVVVSANRQHVQLQGGRRYKVSDDLVAFSTYSLRATSLAGSVGKYAHFGLDGDTVVWLGQIGVVQDAGEGRQVVYEGDLERVDKRRLVFEDGTVLRLDASLQPPKGARGRTLVAIDPVRRVVIGATFASSPAKPDSGTSDR